MGYHTMKSTINLIGLMLAVTTTASNDSPPHPDPADLSRDGIYGVHS